MLPLSSQSSEGICGSKAAGALSRLPQASLKNETSRVADQLDLDDPVAVLLSVLRALETAGIHASAYGGLALATYGEARETKDADVAVCGVPGSVGLLALEKSGLNVTLTFDQMIFGGNLVSRISILGPSDAPGLNMADLVEPRSGRYAKDSLERSGSGNLRGQNLLVLTPEDFVLYKILSTRDRDLEDAASVVRGLGSQLDSALIEREVELLSREIPDHDTTARFRRIQPLLIG